MRYTLICGCATVALLVNARAQIFPGPGTPHTVTAAYAGPGDITTFTAWWGLRAYTAAIAAAGTQPLVKLSRASDSHACDILVATSGGMGNTANCGTGGDNGQSASSFCNATTCSVATVYDQTGGGRNLDTNHSLTFPTLVFNCINSTLPCIDSDGGIGESLASTSNFTPNASGQVSVSIVANQTTGAGFSTLFGENGSANNFMEGNGSNQWIWFGGNAGSLAASAAQNSFHAGNIAVDLTTATTTFNLDGTEGTSTAIFNNTSAGLLVVNEQNSNGHTQLVDAGFIDNSVWSITIRSKLCWNQHVFWGTTASTHCNAAGT